MQNIIHIQPDDTFEITPKFNRYLDGFPKMFMLWLAQRHVALNPEEVMQKDPNWQKHIVFGTELGADAWNYAHGYDDAIRIAPYHGITVSDDDIVAECMPSLWSGFVVEDGCLRVADGDTNDKQTRDEWFRIICDVLNAGGYRCGE